MKFFGTLHSTKTLGFSLLTAVVSTIKAEKIPVMIVDGQNNHDWVSTTDSLHATLQATKRFQIEIETAPQNNQLKEFVLQVRCSRLY